MFNGSFAKPSYKDLFGPEIKDNLIKRFGNGVSEQDAVREGYYYALDMCVEFQYKSEGLLTEDWIEHISHEVYVAIEEYLFELSISEKDFILLVSSAIRDFNQVKIDVNTYYNRLDVVQSREGDLTKESFIQTKLTTPVQQVLMESINLKKIIQVRVIPLVTFEEKMDIRDGRINENVVDKLCLVGALQLESRSSMASLYACTLAIATIIKEYEWGTEYLTTDGLYELATRIVGRKRI